MKFSIRKIVLLLITFVFLYFIFVDLDLKELLRVIKSFDIRYIPFLIISIIISLSFRALCFKQLISQSATPKLTELIQLCLSCAGLNIVLPARAGDFFRAFYIGQKYGVSKVKIFGTVMLERLFDVIVIFCFLLLGVFVYHKNELAMNLCGIAGICIILGIIFVFVSHKFNKTDKICDFIINKTQKIPFADMCHKIVEFGKNTCNSFFNGFEILNSPKTLITVALSAVGIWVFECLNFLITIYGFGYELHWSVAIFIISFIALACMIPSTSIFVGPYQVAVIAAFAIYNVNKEAALAISFAEQAVATILTLCFAIVFLFKNNISFRNLKEEIQKK